MKPAISKLLGIILLKTLIISSSLTFLAYEIINSRHRNSLETNQSDFIGAMAGVFYTFVLTFCTLTIYFNLIDKIKNTPILSFLSFFLSPLIVAFLFWTTGDRNSDWFVFYVNTGIFILILTIFYIRFVRRKMVNSTISK